VRGAIAGVNETSVHGEVLDTEGACIARVLGAEFEFQRSVDCSKHLYQWKWKEIAPAAAGSHAGVLVIAGDPRIAVQIADNFHSRNVECVVVSDAADLQERIEGLGPSCKGIIWASAEQTSAPESAVDEVSDLWVAVRSITSVRSATPASFWLVTTGAHAIDGHSTDAHNLPLPSASQTALRGLTNVIAREHRLASLCAY
jgi:hypothetical protein